MFGELNLCPYATLGPFADIVSLGAVLLRRGHLSAGRFQIVFPCSAFSPVVDETDLGLISFKISFANSLRNSGNAMTAGNIYANEQ